MNVQLKKLKKKNGEELKDNELFQIALKQISEYENETGKKLPFDPSFIEFMKDYVKGVELGENPQRLKQNMIIENFDINRLNLD